MMIHNIIRVGWVNSLEFFCSASETVTDNDNAYALCLISSFAIYPPTAEAYHTSVAPPASPDRLQYVDVYMDDLLCAAQGGAAQKKRVSELMLCTLNEIFPSVPE